MKLILTLITAAFFTTGINAQNNPEANAIVAEGKKLYRSEMASWYGSDIFLERFSDKKNTVGGYFSYADGPATTCIFYSNAAEPEALVTFTFDSTFNTETALVNSTVRKFSPLEKELFSIRSQALEELHKRKLFKHYPGTNFNLIPVIDGDSKKVYVLTGPQQNDVVIFGNDYLLTFDQKNKLVSRKALHSNIIPVKIHPDGKVNGQEITGTLHSHSPETGELITPTDICTLMLYGKLAKWKKHVVVGKTWLSEWDCLNNSLTVKPVSEEGKKFTR